MNAHSFDPSARKREDFPRLLTFFTNTESYGWVRIMALNMVMPHICVLLPEQRSSLKNTLENVCEADHNEEVKKAAAEALLALGK